MVVEATAEMMGHKTADDHPVVPGADEVIAILDAGAQYAKVIDRKVRETKMQWELFRGGCGLWSLVAFSPPGDAL